MAANRRIQSLIVHVDCTRAHGAPCKGGLFGAGSAYDQSLLCELGARARLSKCYKVGLAACQ